MSLVEKPNAALCRFHDTLHWSIVARALNRHTQPQQRGEMSAPISCPAIADLLI